MKLLAIPASAPRQVAFRAKRDRLLRWVFTDHLENFGVLEGLEGSAKSPHPSSMEGSNPGADVARMECI